MQGTIELRTRRLKLRRYRMDDADMLYREFGCDSLMTRYTGWNPYDSEEMARETVGRFIEGYEQDHFYGWAIEREGELIGTAGAYDYDPEADSIEVGCSIARQSWGQGYASEAIDAVMRHLTESEQISCIKAWCASDNIGSRKVMERGGMQLVRTEADAIEVDGCKYDKLYFEYKKDRRA